MELGARRALHAMVGPEYLRPVGRGNGVVGLFAGMRRGEGKVPGRMPILRQHDIAKPCGETIDDRHHLVAARHGERPAGTKIVLHVHHDEDVAAIDGRVFAHKSGSRSLMGPDRVRS